MPSLVGEALDDVVAKHGGQVPHYNIFGQRHTRVPFKDRAHLALAESKPEWTRRPKHSTCTDLLSARRRADVPDLSYDVDGDGGVGPVDHFICRQFGVGVGDVVTSERRQQIVQALEDGWLDKHSFGHDRAGPSRPFPVKQRNGKIVTVDNAHELGEVYPPHPRSSVQPRFATERELRIHRKHEVTSRNAVLNASWHAANPSHVPEPPTAQEFMIQDPRFTQIAQRREAYRQVAREEAGLDPIGSAVNREENVGLGYRERPEHATKTDLAEARKQQRTQQLVETRAQAEKTWVPRDILYGVADHELYESRRADPESMTLTKLKNARKIENIEYQMAHFDREEPQKPSFGKQEKPWWTLRDGYVDEPASSSRATARARSEAPTLPASVAHSDESRSQRVAMHRDAPATMDVYPFLATWHREFAPGALPEHNQPRVFDGVVGGVKQAASYSTDSEPMHHFSSFEAIRRGGAQAASLQQQLAATEDEDRARTWRNYTKKGMFAEEADATLAAPDAAAGSAPGASRAASKSSCLAGAAAAIAATPRVPPLIRSSIAASDVCVRDPTGEDLPMTERLDRLVRRPQRGGHDAASATAARAPSTGGADGEAASQGIRDLSSAMSAARPTATTGASVANVASMGPTASLTSATGAAPMLSAPSALTTAGPPPPPSARGAGGMVVRCSGFQWLDRQNDARQSLELDSAPGSLRPSPSRRTLGSKTTIGAPTPTAPTPLPMS